MARQASSASAGIEEEIVIPPRIERGPTDILRALASTVGTDFTAPHYRYRYTVLYFPFESGDYLAKLSWLFSSNKILKIVLSYCFYHRPRAVLQIRCLFDPWIPDLGCRIPKSFSDDSFGLKVLQFFVNWLILFSLPVQK